MFTIVGWVIWGITLLFGLGHFLSSNPDPGVRSMMRINAWTSVVCGAIVAALPINPAFFALTFPIWMIVPTLFVKRRLDNAVNDWGRAMEESQRTGRPVSEILGLPDEDERV